MRITGLHLLLTYQCTLECDHCFVWGSPKQSGTMTLRDIGEILQQAKEVGSIEWIYFEGGEPFLFYATMSNGMRQAAEMGFKVGVVTNGYWATSLEDARENLKPLAGLVQDLSVSSDLFHYDEKISRQCQWALAAADEMSIPVGVISIAQPCSGNGAQSSGQLPLGESRMMFRGRAVDKLAAEAAACDWQQFNECPYEDLNEPGRVHLDALGNVHICQGISVGNFHKNHLSEIFANYDPVTDPIISTLIKGGPAELLRRYEIAPQENYADACHLCYQARVMLRDRFAQVLGPDQVYGVF
ncbi:MAG: radical SAM protein [Anaerolineales bacterium]